MGQQTMLMNENRLSPINPEHRKFIEAEMEKFFFGEGSEIPEGYIPEKWQLACIILDLSTPKRFNTALSDSRDKLEKCGQIAQSVEQRIENQRVDGSIPPLATILIEGSAL